jgi:transcriptional regulator with XRE-family HTH domain
MTASVDDLCKQHKVTVKELADRSGLDEQRVTAIYMGRWTPSPKEREAIASAFGLTPADIAWGHKTPIQHIYGHGPG